MFLIVILVVIGLLLCFIYPLILFCEFRKNFILSCQLYPHITLFPILFSWMMLIIMYQFLSLEHNWIDLIKKTIPFFALTYLALQVELKSNEFLMIFELKDNATVEVPIYKIKKNFDEREFINNYSLYLSDKSQLVKDKQKTDKEENVLGFLIKKKDIYNILEKLLKSRTRITEKEEEQIIKYQKWFKFILSYELWKIDPKSFSYSRLMYGFSFYFLSSTMLNAIVLLVNSIFSKSQFIENFYYTVGICMVFIFWVPLRLYCNTHIKHILFGSKKVVTGRIEQFIPLALLVFIFFSLLGILSRFTQIKLDTLKIFLLAAIVIICLILSMNSNLVDITFGTKSKPITWVIWIFLGIFLLYLL